MNVEKTYAIKKDIAERLAEKRGITVKDAKSIVNDVVDISVDFLADPEVDGIMLRNLLTIEKTTKQGRSGVVPMNGKKYSKPSTQKLKISTGRIMLEMLNK